VHLSSGITGVVGPNGCGKSNIVDALRWVLGEQRASQLRSTAMASVIFNGTKDRKKAGFSEVALTINNNRGLLPSEFEELTITRRLFRTGQSEYLLNGTACRLKDIHALFVDTGLSTNAYSVIELKAVEGIVDDRNNERRKLFEEAAGVTKFKEQRRDTYKKLKETKEDLQRLSDILLTMEKKVKSLETQSRKARQLKELQAELLELDQVSAAFEFHKITAELTPLQNQLKQAESDKIAIQNALEQAEKHLNATRESSSASLEREELLNQNYIRYQEQYSQLQTQLKLDTQQATLLEDQAQNTATEIEESEARLHELQDLLKHARLKFEMVDSSYKQSESLLSEAKEQFEDLLQRFK
jgi:Chromosome segregation ATPases